MTCPPPKPGNRFPAAALALALALAPGAALLQGCATNPATGGTMLSFMSPDEESRLGSEEHPKLVKAFGGEVADPALRAYVQSVGTLLARTSELPELNFTFTVLDTDMVNAFALPGGYVYITRGILSLANTEAEMAGVLAHEIGHVTARHAAQRHSRSVLAGLGVGAVAILTGSRGLAELAGSGAGVHLASYSREHELEADTLGVRYLARAGFDTRAMASFLANLRAHSRLDARIQGLPPDKVDEANLLATHPRTVERVEHATAQAGVAPVADPVVGRDVYLAKIDGMIHGDSPEQGFARGRDFVHPRLRFRFRVPEGFRLRNMPDRVLARGPDGAAILFDGAKRPANRTPLDYLVNVWARSLRLGGPERITVNGLPAATATARVNTSDGARDVRLVVIQDGADRLWRFLFATPPALTGRLNQPLRETTYSFRRISAAEAARWRPVRIRLHRVGRGETVAALAGRMAVDGFAEEHFRVLNGLGAGEGVRAGQTVKLVLEDRR